MLSTYLWPVWLSTSGRISEIYSNLRGLGGWTTIYRRLSGRNAASPAPSRVENIGPRFLNDADLKIENSSFVDEGIGVRRVVLVRRERCSEKKDEGRIC